MRADTTANRLRLPLKEATEGEGPEVKDLHFKEHGQLQEKAEQPWSRVGHWQGICHQVEFIEISFQPLEAVVALRQCSALADTVQIQA